MLSHPCRLLFQLRSAEDCLRRRQRRQRVAQPVNCSAFKIDKPKRLRRADAGRRIEQLACLLRILNIALEENDPARPNDIEPCPFQAGQRVPDKPTTSNSPPHAAKLSSGS